MHEGMYTRTHTYIHELCCILHDAVQSVQVRQGLHDCFILRSEGVLSEGLNEVADNCHVAVGLRRGQHCMYTILQ